MTAVLSKTDSSIDPVVAVLIRNETDLSHPLLKSHQNIISQKMNERDNGYISIYTDSMVLIVAVFKDSKDKSDAELMEEARVKGGNIAKRINYEKSSSVLAVRASNSISKTEILAFTEGIALSNYQFLKYKSEKKENSLQKVLVNDNEIAEAELQEINNVIRANEIAKNLGNEPVIALNSVQLGENILEISRALNFKAEVLNKSQIEALRMGGLLGVNFGSSSPSYFFHFRISSNHCKK
jgi:leucyl aminopeptidase